MPQEVRIASRYEDITNVDGIVWDALRGMTKVNPDGTREAAGGRSKTVIFQPAQVGTFFSQPNQVVVPAPGPGLAIIPLVQFINYQYKGTPYVDHGGNFVIAVGGSGWWQFATAGFWDQTASQVKYTTGGAPSVMLLSGWVNQSLNVSQTVADPTGGNGTVQVTINYIVIPVA